MVSGTVVSVGIPFAVNAESGTISKPSLSMFQASIRHEPPPFSYIQTSSGKTSALMSISPDSIHVQPWSTQSPHSLPSMSMMPPSSVANQNSIVSCSGISMKPVM